MPRKKAEAEVPAEAAQPQPPAIIADTDENMVARYLALKAWIEGEKKRFDAYLEPHKGEMDAIEGEFLKRFNERGQDASPTEHGTAYKSVLMNVKITDRDKLLDLCLDNWAEIGGDMLIISAQKDAVKSWMESHEGHPPTGVEVSHFTRVNVRRA